MNGDDLIIYWGMRICYLKVVPRNRWKLIYFTYFILLIYFNLIFEIYFTSSRFILLVWKSFLATGEHLFILLIWFYLFDILISYLTFILRLQDLFYLFYFFPVSGKNWWAGTSHLRVRVESPAFHDRDRPPTDSTATGTREDDPATDETVVWVVHLDRGNGGWSGLVRQGSKF